MCKIGVQNLVEILLSGPIGAVHASFGIWKKQNNVSLYNWEDIYEAISHKIIGFLHHC